MPGDLEYIVLPVQLDFDLVFADFRELASTDDPTASTEWLLDQVVVRCLRR